MRGFTGFAGLLVVFMLAVQAPAQAQFVVSLNEALEQQLTTNGVADPANATGEELGAAIEALVANNPSLIRVRQFLSPMHALEKMGSWE